MQEPDAHNLVIRRTEWDDEDIALLCGVANAGGGSILVSPTMSNHSRKMKHFRKSFETIPRTSQQELGITCVTEPVMDGVELCLEIRVPAADTPIRYRNNYYLYADGVNTVVTKELLKRFFFSNHDETDEPMDATQESIHENTPASTPPEHPETNTDTESASASRDALDQEQEQFGRTQQAQAGTSTAIPDQPRRQTFKERSIAAANRLDMTSTDEYILKVLETNGRVTATRIAEVLGVSESTVRRSFRRLKEYGFIERIGSNKAGYWRVVD